MCRCFGGDEIIVTWSMLNCTVRYSSVHCAVQWVRGSSQHAYKAISNSQTPQRIPRPCMQFAQSAPRESGIALTSHMGLPADAQISSGGSVEQLAFFPEIAFKGMSGLRKALLPPMIICKLPSTEIQADFIKCITFIPVFRVYPKFSSV